MYQTTRPECAHLHTGDATRANPLARGSSTAEPRSPAGQPSTATTGHCTATARLGDEPGHPAKSASNRHTAPAQNFTQVYTESARFCERCTGTCRHTQRPRRPQCVRGGKSAPQARARDRARCTCTAPALPASPSMRTDVGLPRTKNATEKFLAAKFAAESPSLLVLAQARRH